MPPPSSPDLAGHGAILLAGPAEAASGAPPGGGDEEPLVRRVARAVVEAGFWPVVVVVRSGDCAVRAALAGLPVASAACATGAEPAGALRRGLARIAECAPQARGVLVAACSAPAPDGLLLRRLAAAASADHPLAAVERAGRLGLPLIVRRELFDELRGLEDGDEDAAALVRRDPARVARVPISGG